MDSAKYRLDEFTKTLLAEAREGAKSREEEAKSKGRARLSQAKEEMISQIGAYRRRRLREISAREGRRVSTHLLESREQLFAYRQACAETVSALVIQKIQQFTAQDAYGAQLKSLLDRAWPSLDPSTAAIVLLRPQDMVYRDILSRGRACIFRPGEFALGGLVAICESRFLRVDLTFDTALESAMDHFVELFAMDLT